MDDDGLPSSYIQRILGAIAKWRVKMHNIISSLENLEEAPETVEASLSLTVVLFIHKVQTPYDIKETSFLSLTLSCCMVLSEVGQACFAN